MSWLKTLGKQGNRTEVVDHPNGGQEVWQDGLLVSVRYHTGDVVHLEFSDGEYRVTKVERHDALSSE